MVTHKKIVLYSCIINNRDELKQIEFDDGFKKVLFTDNLNLKSRGWEVRPPVWESEDPTRTSRYHKHHPFNLFPNFDYAIWLDMTHWPYKSLKSLLTNNFMSLYKHPKRNTIKEEANICAGLKFDEPFLIQSQIKHYEEEGFNDDFGLYVTSCLIMKNTSEYRSLSSLWWEQISRWSKRDQISLPYCLWKLGLRPNVIPGVERNGFNPYFKFKSHHK